MIHKLLISLILGYILATFVCSYCLARTPVNNDNFETEGKLVLKAIVAKIKASPEASPYFKQAVLKLTVSNTGDLGEVIGNALLGPSANDEMTSSGECRDSKEVTGSNVLWEFKHGVTIISGSGDGRVPPKQLLATDKAIILNIFLESGRPMSFPFDREWTISTSPNIVVGYHLEMKKEDKVLRSRIEQIIRDEIPSLQ